MDRRKKNNTDVVFAFSEHTQNNNIKGGKSKGRQGKAGEATTNKNNSNRRSNGTSEVMPGEHRRRTCGRTWSDQGGAPARIEPLPSTTPTRHLRETIGYSALFLQYFFGAETHLASSGSTSETCLLAIPAIIVFGSSLRKIRTSSHCCCRCC